MSILELNKIDVIGDERNAEIVSLGISDHLDWNNAEEHIEYLQEKINAYLTFIESGQLIEERPTSKGKKINIEISAKFKIPKSIIKQYYNDIEKVLNDAGYGFSYYKLDD